MPAMVTRTPNWRSASAMNKVMACRAILSAPGISMPAPRATPARPIWSIRPPSGTRIWPDDPHRWLAAAPRPARSAPPPRSIERAEPGDREIADLEPMPMLPAIVALLLQATAAPSGAYPPDADCQNYGNGGTIDVDTCLGRQSTAWQARLDQAYRAALDSGEVDRAALAKTQRSWRAYRDDNCAMYERVQGSIHAILVNKCWRDMTRDRTLELDAMRWNG
ncbi:DUF1311 domain-containing protein [Sphingomonas koreensis]|nr:DUF1311 domain-containing protein [Sphingomonas koreensis]